MKLEEVRHWCSRGYASECVAHSQQGAFVMTLCGKLTLGPIREGAAGAKVCRNCARLVKHARAAEPVACRECGERIKGLAYAAGGAGPLCELCYEQMKG